MNINLEYYKIFYFVNITGSFTAAAQTLCISQPAVSQAIKSLEISLGSKLFIRTSKGVKLTPEGEVLFSYVQKGYEYIRLGENTFQKMLDLENGEIRVGASDMTLQFYLLPFLEQFHKLYPRIKVTVSNAPTPETINQLYEGKIDFGIVSSPFETRQGMHVTKVKEIEDIFVAGNRFWHIKNDMITYEKLEKLPIICLEHNTSTRQYMDEYLFQNGVALKPEIELANSNMIVQFAIRNFGIGCVVSDFAEAFINSGELFELRLQKKIPKRNICIITGNYNPISTAARKLLALLQIEV